MLSSFLSSIVNLTRSLKMNVDKRKLREKRKAKENTLKREQAKSKASKMRKIKEAIMAASAVMTSNNSSS